MVLSENILDYKTKHKAMHINCNKCDFVSKSAAQSKRHFEVRHKDNPDCWFWCNALCRNPSCRFEHPRSKESMNKSNLPRTQESMNRTNLPNPRNERIPCRYQERCQKPNCQFVHFLGPNQAWNQRW